MTQPISRLLLTQTAQGAGTVNGGSIEIPHQHGVAYLDITAETGTATLDVDIEGFDTVSGKWLVIDSFPQQSAVGTVRLAVDPLLDNPIRATGLIAGTTPTMTYTVSITTKE